MLPSPRRLVTDVARRAGIRSLRKQIHELRWCGPLPEIDPERPLVVYANHQNFWDGHVANTLVLRLFERELAYWMADWDSYPFFALTGALPFPPDDPPRRVATLRRSVRFLNGTPQATLVIFPEGRIHPPETDLLAFDLRDLRVLQSQVDDLQWLPLGIHATFRDAPRPTVLAGAGPSHDAPDADGPTRLRAVLSRLRDPDVNEPQRRILSGPSFDPTRWDFRFLRPLFERWL